MQIVGSGVNPVLPREDIYVVGYGKGNPIPKVIIVKMKRVEILYKKAHMGNLKGYMCDRCGEVDLGVDTVPDDSGAHLYWLETGNHPFDGAVCPKCFVADPMTKRPRRKPTR